MNQVVQLKTYGTFVYSPPLTLFGEGFCVNFHLPEKEVKNIGITVILSKK